MAIHFNREESRYEVFLGSLLYSFHYCMYEAHEAIQEYHRLKKVGRA